MLTITAFHRVVSWRQRYVESCRFLLATLIGRCKNLFSIDGEECTVIFRVRVSQKGDVGHALKVYAKSFLATSIMWDIRTTGALRTLHSNLSFSSYVTTCIFPSLAAFYRY